MTKTRFLLPVAFGAAVLSILTGCISRSHVSYDDTDRVKVAFATEKAGRVFYEALGHSPAEKTETHTEVNLILIDFDHRTVRGPNRLFNEAVAFCDSDHDGTVTETEAEIFAGAWPKHRS